MASFAPRTATLTARLLSAAASDNATIVIARRCVVNTIQGHNAKASAVYLKIYDKATAPASTDTPRRTIYLPASSSFVFDFASGLEFTAGLGYRIVTDNADAGVTAVAAGDILGLNLDYWT